MNVQKCTDLNQSANFVFNEVKKKLEDRKTTIFITVVAVNIFLWGLLLAEYRQTNKELAEVKEKISTSNVYQASIQAELKQLNRGNK